MVQTYQSPVRVYKYPFELVMAAYEKRFPTSPLIPIFVGSEILCDSLTDDGAVHVVERKCQLNIDAPYLLKKIAGIDFVYFMQKNTLDRRKRTLKIEARNLSFSSRVVVNEQCLYYVHSENRSWTCFEQSASLDVKSFFGFEATVEKIAVKQYASNISKGKEIIEHYIAELMSEGITYIPPFEGAAEEEDKSAILKSPTADSAIDLSKAPETTSKSYGDEDLPTMREKTPSFGAKIRSRSGTLIKTTAGSSIKQPTLTSQLSTEDGEGKLEADYIQRFLGALTPLEESRLCELRYSLHAAHKGKLPNDAHLLRFLRAQDFDVHRAREMVASSMLWRKQHNVDKILSTYQPPKVMSEYFPGAWHHHDLHGRPLFVLRLGQVDIKGLFRAVGPDGIVKFILSICEEGLRRAETATKDFGKPISTWTLLVDLEGLSMRHLWRPGIRTLLQIIEIVEANYPETMGYALIVRAPRVFPVLWTLIGPFINERTRQKFMFYSGNDYLTSLRDYIDEKHVPFFLDGGRSHCAAPDGGHVPKSMYIRDEENDQKPTIESGDVSSTAHILESVYATGYVYKGMPHEVIVPIVTKGAVLTWDFDVAKGACEFLILRVQKILQPESVKQSSPGPTSGLSALSPTGLMAAAAASHQNTPVAFDRSLELGVDVFIEEKPLICHEGESVQGSHSCTREGTYILQWRYPTDGSVQQSHASHTFDFSISLIHKCKFMYYYEVLDSANFKGSMASLESCRSSFSSLSLATTGVSSGNGNGAGSSQQNSTSATPISIKRRV